MFESLANENKKKEMLIQYNLLQLKGLVPPLSKDFTGMIPVSLT
jgi:hypothetical protein